MGEEMILLSQTPLIKIDVGLLVRAIWIPFSMLEIAARMCGVSSFHSAEIISDTPNREQAIPLTVEFTLEEGEKKVTPLFWFFYCDTSVLTEGFPIVVIK